MHIVYISTSFWVVCLRQSRRLIKALLFGDVDRHQGLKSFECMHNFNILPDRGPGPLPRACGHFPTSGCGFGIPGARRGAHHRREIPRAFSSKTRNGSAGSTPPQMCQHQSRSRSISIFMHVFTAKLFAACAGW